MVVVIVVVAVLVLVVVLVVVLAVVIVVVVIVVVAYKTRKGLLKRQSLHRTKSHQSCHLMIIFECQILDQGLKHE